MTGAVAGREENIDLITRELELLAPLERVLGVPGLERAEAGPRNERVDVREDELLDLGHPHLGSRRPRHRPHRADVVEVGVREQDPVERDAHLVDGR